MMGHWQRQTEVCGEPVHLGRRIPPDHLLRQISSALDLSFVRQELAGFYESNGNGLGRVRDDRQCRNLREACSILES